MEPEMREYYSQGREQDRLKQMGKLEYLRTQELLRRFLSRPPARVIDVGGAAGVHALPLMEAGYDVTLVDPVDLHIEQAHAAGVMDAVAGDARDLALEDDLFDATVLLGPLYHLTERADRVIALREARRVTRPGGVLMAACISRFASTLDGLLLQYLADPAFEGIVDQDVATGQHRNPTARSGWFTTAYLHHPDEIEGELVDGGWEPQTLLAIEGPGVFADMEFWLDGSERQEVLMRAISRVEAEPSLMGSSPHLMAVGKKASKDQQG